MKLPGFNEALLHVLFPMLVRNNEFERARQLISSMVQRRGKIAPHYHPLVAAQSSDTKADKWFHFFRSVVDKQWKTPIVALCLQPEPRYQWIDLLLKEEGLTTDQWARRGSQGDNEISL